MKKIIILLALIFFNFYSGVYAQSSFHFVSHLCQVYQNKGGGGPLYTIATVSKIYFDDALCTGDTTIRDSGHFQGCAEKCSSGTPEIKNMFDRQPDNIFPYIFFKNLGFENVMYFGDSPQLPRALEDQTVNSLKEGGATEIQVIYPRK